MCVSVYVSVGGFACLGVFLWCLHVFVCIASVRVSMFVCLCVYISLCAFLHRSLFISLFVSLCVCVCVNVSSFASMCTFCVYVCVCLFVSV